MPELRAETTKSLLVATQKGKTNILAGSQPTHDDKIIERMFLSSQPEAIKSVHSGNTLEDLVSVDKTLTESQTGDVPANSFSSRDLLPTSNPIDVSSPKVVENAVQEPKSSDTLRINTCTEELSTLPAYEIEIQPWPWFKVSTHFLRTIQLIPVSLLCIFALLVFAVWVQFPLIYGTVCILEVVTLYFFATREFNFPSSFAKDHIFATFQRLMAHRVELVHGSNSLTIVGKLDNVQTHFLIDTGAAVSAVNEEFLKKLSKDRFSVCHDGFQNLTSVDGNRLSVQGKVKLPMTIQDQSFLFDFHVIRNIAYEAILGRDFLKQHNCQINIATGAFEFEAPTFDFPFANEASIDEDSNRTESPVHVVQTFELEPHSETIVNAKWSFPFNKGTVGLITPRKDLLQRYLILGVSELVTVSSNGTVPIRLLNPTEKPVTLFHKAKLATFEALDQEIATFELHEASDKSGDSQSTAGTKVQSGNMDFSQFPDIDKSNLDSKQQEQLRNLLTDYCDVFAFSSSELGRTNIVRHTIDTGDHQRY